MEDRRQAERLPAFCMGTCHVEGEPSDQWWECAIIDASTMGLGIELCHPDPVELLGLWQDGELQLSERRRITVCLDLGPSVDMTVEGEVRHAGSRPDGVVRVGIKFVGLTESQCSMIRVLQRPAVSSSGELLAAIKSNRLSLRS